MTIASECDRIDTRFVSREEWADSPVSAVIASVPPGGDPCSRNALLRIVVAAVAPCSAATSRRSRQVRVGSKNFTEQFIVAEIYAQALEAAGIKVERKINLGGTLIAHKALEEKQIDLYPEYTGTMLLAVLKAARHDRSQGRLRQGQGRVCGQGTGAC